MTAATPTVQIDNEQVRVTEWRFAPGEETGWHTHTMDYVVVPLYDGVLRIESNDGTVDVPLRHGQLLCRAPPAWSTTSSIPVRRSSHSSKSS